MVASILKSAMVALAQGGDFQYVVAWGEGEGVASERALGLLELLGSRDLA